MVEENPQIHPSITLCLACSSSLPPRASPICPSCLSSNPRLARYNPCLACLGGVGVVSASLGNVTAQDVNMDGALRDEDMFVLGDDEDDEEGGDEEGLVPERSMDYPPPQNFLRASPSRRPQLERDTHSNVTAPPVYYIRRGDTLQGIALRLGVNHSHHNPHLLHTRTSLKLPPTAHPHAATPPVPDADTESRRVRERAAKRLQILTKEVDWGVAKAYVAIADDPEEDVAYALKLKEMGGTSAGGSYLEARAVDQYLEDQEWEEEQRKAGRIRSWLVFLRNVIGKWNGQLVGLKLTLFDYGTAIPT
ncbi:hypothetical protein BU15DRAFT_89039 [Melanogaster broomeanus]|nr:hypothetical protein BU15DRAFT_89039 [Melanogaster broomeanus]